MQLKRFTYFLIINVFVSVITTLVVLTIWDRTHHPENSRSDPIANLPDIVLPSVTPEVLLEPTQALKSYQVSDGETLGEIALAYDVTVDELLEINGFNNPDSIGAGTVIFVPIGGAGSDHEATDLISDSAVGIEDFSLPENPEIEIVAIIGAGDLRSERVQLRGVGEGSLSLAGWKLRDEDQMEYAFPAITLFGNGAVNIFSSAGVDTVVALFWGLPSAVWESGEIATLIDNNGMVQAIYQVP